MTKVILIAGPHGLDKTQFANFFRNTVLFSDSKEPAIVEDMPQDPARVSNNYLRKVFSSNDIVVMVGESFGFAWERKIVACGGRVDRLVQVVYNEGEGSFLWDHDSTPKTPRMADARLIIPAGQLANFSLYCVSRQKTLGRQRDVFEVFLDAGACGGGRSPKLYLSPKRLSGLAAFQAWLDKEAAYPWNKEGYHFRFRGGERDLQEAVIKMQQLPLSAVSYFQDIDKGSKPSDEAKPSGVYYFRGKTPEQKIPIAINFEMISEMGVGKVIDCILGRSTAHPDSRSFRDHLEYGLMKIPDVLYGPKNCASLRFAPNDGNWLCREVARGILGENP